MSNQPRQRRAEQKQATERAVLAAARAEFEEVGFEAANLRSIARRAGVSAGTVLHHAGDKRMLLHAALFDELDTTLRRALAATSQGPLEAQLRRLTNAVFRSYQKRPGLSRTLLKESLFADEPWASRFAGQTTLVHQRVTEWAQAAIERGELGGDFDPARFALAYLSFFYFALIGWTQGGLAAPVGVVERLVSQHLDGARPLSPRSRR